MTVAFYNGVPFKYAKTIRDHTRFVHAVEFSPNGDHFVSVGADGKVSFLLFIFSWINFGKRFIKQRQGG